MARLVAAMSGGVDSAVAAARAVAAGHDVIGVHLALSKSAATLRESARGCCTLEDAADARRVADLLEIPFYVWDLSDRFDQDVVADFVSEYAAGRTPNPCIRCNEKVKFAALLDKSLALGFDGIVTGHYARIVRGSAGSVELHRAHDRSKDQSYVLATLTGDQLRAVHLPLGEDRKEEVRSAAAALGLPVAAKPDSHDICFIPDGDTRAFLSTRLRQEPGPVVDETGAVVGRHEGAAGFTVGQRHGLRLSTPAPDGRPRYVLQVRPTEHTVVVGPRESLDVSWLTGIRTVWHGPAPDGDVRVGAQVRAHGLEVPGVVRVAGEAAHLRLDEPICGVAPGQTVAFYRGTQVLGGATVDLTSPRRAPAR